MGQQIIRQPNGNYAIWTSVSDGFIAVDLTRDEVVEHFKDQAAEHAEERVTRHLDKIDSGKNPYHQFAIPWDDAVREHRERWDDDQAELIRAASEKTDDEP